VRVETSALEKPPIGTAQRKLPPDGERGLNVEREEMIRILETIIRDPHTNTTARCTAIRTLRDFRSSRKPMCLPTYTRTTLSPGAVGAAPTAADLGTLPH